MSKIISFLKLIFYISIAFLVIVSVFPGSLLGLLFYGDSNLQPQLVKNPFGSTINHFIYYLYVSLLGLLLYQKSNFFKKLVFTLFFLSIFLEVIQVILPIRAFQIGDLIGNILGVLVSYFLVKIYLRLVNHE